MKYVSVTVIELNNEEAANLVNETVLKMHSKLQRKDIPHFSANTIMSDKDAGQVVGIVKEYHGPEGTLSHVDNLVKQLTKMKDKNEGKTTQ